MDELQVYKKDEIVPIIKQELTELNVPVLALIEATKIDQIMLQADHETRLALIDTMYDKSFEMYPTMSNPDRYNEIVPAATREKHFDINIRGAVLGHDDDGLEIVSAGGMNTEYLNNVKQLSHFFNWKFFWLMLSELEDKSEIFLYSIPDFEWNIEHINRYVYSCLPPTIAVIYLKYLLYKLYRIKDDLPEVPFENVSQWITKHLALNRQILNISAEKEENIENEIKTRLYEQKKDIPWK